MSSLTPAHELPQPCDGDESATSSASLAPAPVTPRGAESAPPRETPDVCTPATLVTFVTHAAPELEKLRASAAAVGAELQVVTVQERFGARYGWGPRLLAMHEFVADAARFLRLPASCGYLEELHNGSHRRVLLDSSSRVFQCLWNAKDHFERDPASGLWRNKITGCVVVRRGSTATAADALLRSTMPVIWHGNGGLNAFLFDTFGEQHGAAASAACLRFHCAHHLTSRCPGADATPHAEHPCDVRPTQECSELSRPALQVSTAHCAIWR
jgi:hypothetical protein